MARARNIKPGFFRNADLVELPVEARLLFIGLWTIADREGCYSMSMAVCLRQFSGKKMPWWNRASIKKVNTVSITEKSVKVNNNQQSTEATQHMLHTNIAKSHNGLIKMSPETPAPAHQPTKPAVSAQTSREHHSVADVLRKALRGVLDDFGCLSVRDLIPIIQEQDAQEEVQEIFESWHQAVYPLNVLELAAA